MTASGSSAGATARRPLVVAPDVDADARGQLEEECGDLRRLAELKAFVGRPGSEEEYRHRLEGADALLLSWDLPSAVLAAAPGVRAISFLGSGVSNFLNLEAAGRAGIVVMNVPRYGDAAVAEHTLALILAVVRRVVAYDRSVRDGAWGVDGMTRELASVRLGLLGLGGIGSLVGQLARAVGMPVCAWTRSGRPGEQRDGIALESLDAVLAGSDFVSLHLPLAPDTMGILSSDRFSGMKPGAVLVNTARAELVDQPALVEALRSGRLAGAALDVFTSEPLPIEDALRSMPNVILTPHVAFATEEASRRLMRGALANLVGYFEGTPSNVVVPGPGLPE